MHGRWRPATCLLLTGLFTLGIVATAVAESSVGADVDVHRVAATDTRTEDAAVAPRIPDALAIGGRGTLYVIDSQRDQVLARHGGDNWSVIAGSGCRGFSGDGGPATKACLRLTDLSGIAVASDGTIYVSDTGNDRVRAIRGGIIRTILGNGQAPSPIVNPRSGPLRGFAPTSGPSLALGSPTGVAWFDGRLYVAASYIVELSRRIASWIAGGKLLAAPGGQLLESQFDGSSGIAVNGARDLFVVNPTSFGLAEIEADGKSVELGRSVGFGAPDKAVISTGSDGTVFVAGLNGLYRVEGSETPVRIAVHLVSALGSGSMGFVPYGIGVANNNEIYLSTNPTPQWTSEAAIVAVLNEKSVHALWSRR